MGYTLILLVAMFILGFIVGAIKSEDMGRLSDSSIKDILKREWQQKLDGRANEWD
jgi:hypothetical protein